MKKQKKVQHLDYPTFFMQVYIYIYELHPIISHVSWGFTHPASSPDDNHPPQRRHGGEHRRLCLGREQKLVENDDFTNKKVG